MSDSLQEHCARAAYEEGLPHRWQLIYRVQARAVLDLLDAEAAPAAEVLDDQPDLFGEVS